MGIESYSTTPSSNTALFPENQTPSSVNDGMRQVQADVRAFYNEPNWLNYGYSIAYGSGTSFVIAGVDATPPFHANRRLKIVGSTTGTVKGKITGSVYSGGDTTVSVALDTGSLQNESLTVYVSGIRADDGQVPGLLAGQVLGSAALANTGTSGAAVPFLNGSNTWSGSQIFNGVVQFAGEFQAIDTSDDNKGEFLARTTGGATGTVGRFKGQGQDSGGNWTTFGTWGVSASDVTDGSEDGTLFAQLKIAGVDTTVGRFGPGFRSGDPTGGDKGLGSINAESIYINNVAVDRAATTGQTGIVELATAAETLTGTDTGRAMTPGGFAANADLASFGYCKLPGGLILQWGSGSTGVGGTVAVSFPTAFASFVRFTATAAGDTAEDTGAVLGYKTLTTSGVTVISYTLTGANPGELKPSTSFQWFAVGV